MWAFSTGGAVFRTSGPCRPWTGASGMPFCAHHRLKFNLITPTVFILFADPQGVGQKGRDQIYLVAASSESNRTRRTPSNSAVTGCRRRRTDSSARPRPALNKFHCHTVRSDCPFRPVDLLHANSTRTATTISLAAGTNWGGSYPSSNACRLLDGIREIGPSDRGPSCLQKTFFKLSHSHTRTSMVIYRLLDAGSTGTYTTRIATLPFRVTIPFASTSGGCEHTRSNGQVNGGDHTPRMSGAGNLALRSWRGRSAPRR